MRRPAAPAARSLALSALLLAWTGVALAAGASVERGEAAILLPALAALVGVAGLWRPLPFTGVGVAVLSTVAFTAVRILVSGGGAALPPAVVALVGLSGVGLLADLLARQAVTEEQQRRRDALLVEELTPTQGEGALKWQHGSRYLADEIWRARRYQHPLSLSVVALDDWQGLIDGVGADGARKVLDQAVALALREVRPMDRVAYRGDGEIVLILPHTPLGGALVAVEKLRQKVVGELQHDLCAGVAEFPTDAVTPEELVIEADAALDFARGSEIRVASRNTLATDG